MEPIQIDEEEKRKLRAAFNSPQAHLIDFMNLIRRCREDGQNPASLFHLAEETIDEANRVGPLPVMVPPPDRECDLSLAELDEATE